AEDALKLVGNLHRAIDTVYQQGALGEYKPDCKAGCSHCCHLHVEVLDAEALQIAEEIRHRPPGELAILLERLQDQAVMRNASPPMTRSISGCAFLADGLCSIYSVRPATCRKGHSLSVQQCREAASQLPQNLQVIAESEALIAGISGAYREAGLPSASRELAAAVLLALTDDAAKSKWYAGASSSFE
ncbi:MAG TPA: YkgJ family cysteine cluster protein, partial [Rhodocyclaceae bacterium]|nr:YkgJ family cysteine cluster protein [Rhodocyclaceae bacterium]